MDADRPEIIQLSNLITEITEQLNQNKAMIAKLQDHIQQLKEQASKCSESGPLRRFNTDVSKEIFTTEIERLSVALVMENQTLLHENKQLNSLLQDYESTLENVMTKFRNHAYAAQTHQATLVKHYESLLTQELGNASLGETSGGGIDPGQFHTLRTLIEDALRCLEGKDPAVKKKGNLDGKEDDGAEEEGEESGENEEGGNGVRSTWVEEREFEIQRLEKENAELRKALGISAEQERNLGLDDTEMELARHMRRDSRSLSFRSPNKRNSRRLSANVARKEGEIQP